MKIIEFELLGLQLQEPMSLIMNWLISLLCFFCYVRLGKSTIEYIKYWRLFFLYFGISTIFGGLGHLFFKYFDVYGKIPCWTIGVIGGYFASKGTISLLKNNLKKKWEIVLIVKCVALWFLGILTLKFIFISIDATLSYLVFCGAIGYCLYKQGYTPLIKVCIGVLILLPSAFIFGFGLNIHDWFNKDDLSHVLMILCIYYFYLAAADMKEFRFPKTEKIQNI